MNKALPLITLIVLYAAELWRPGATGWTFGKVFYACLFLLNAAILAMNTQVRPDIEES